MSDTTTGDLRPETPPLRMKIRPASPVDDYDPVEPSRPGLQAAVQIETPGERPAQAAPAIHAPVEVAPETFQPVKTQPAQTPVTAVATTAAPSENEQPAVPPVRRSFRSTGTVTLTNRLSIDHRELLQEMAEAEGVTIRSILEKSLDLYAVERHSDLNR